MKKTIIILSALIALVGCSKENTQPENTPNVFNITITHEGDTKAVKAGWEDGDVVYVFFSTVAAPNYVKFSYDGTDWSSTKMGTFDITTAGTMTAIYLPYGNTETVSTDGTNFKFENTYTSYYLKAEKAPYTVSGGVVSGTLSMVVPDGFVQFAMPISGTVHGDAVQFFRETAGAYTLKESHLTPCAFASVAADGTISNMTGEDYTAGKPITGYIYGGDINFSGLLTPGTATYSFQFVNNMGTVETYDDVTYILTGNKTIAARAAIKFPLISSSSWKVPVPEGPTPYVTVGGFKWAKWNVGATTKTGYGDYFSWGAIYPQYKYKGDYHESLGENDIDSAHDVANQKLGGDWHMPTKDQIEALSSKISSSTWRANYLETGVNGHLIAPDTGHESEGSLFLPAAGRWLDVLYSAGYYGGCWSSSYLNTYNAWYLYFYDDFANVSYYGRNFGYSVRPVHD